MAQDPANQPPKPKRKKTIKLGLGRRQNGGKRNYYPYDICKQIVQQFQFNTRTEFERWIHKESDNYPLIPLAPHLYYKRNNCAFSWDDFLGETFRQNRNKHGPGSSRYISYEEFVKFVNTNRIICQKHLDELYEKGAVPEDVPPVPARVYKDQWEGWTKITGIDVRGRGKFREILAEAPNQKATQTNVLQLLPFHLFRQEVRKQCFSFKQQYFDWVKENKLTVKGYSNTPDTYYMKLGVWTDWPDVLGIFDPNTPTFAQKTDYIQAKKFAQSLGLKSVEEWRAWCVNNQNIRPDVPRYPETVYSDWEGWDIFLGKHISEVVNSHRHNTSVLWIARTTKRVCNVYEISIDTNGIASAYEDVLIAKDYELVALYEYEEQVYNNVPLETIIKHIIDNNTDGVYERWVGGISLRYDGVIIGNIHQLKYDLSEFLVEIPIVVPEHIRVIKRKYEQTGINHHQKSQDSNVNTRDDYGVEDLL